MKHVFSALLFFLAFPLFLFSQSKSLIINEIQPSNHNTIVDQYGNHEDWIELYNAGSTTVDLSGWSLTDDASRPKKWSFEGGTLQPNAYLIVFASDKDIKNPDSTLHTNFKLTATGDYLALFDPSGNKVQELNPIPRLDTDYSYGLLNGMWVEFTIPTAGAQNVENGLYRFPTPIFSVKHGLHDQPFVLGIRCDLPGALVYYTEDGSVPSPQNGHLYEGQMVVSGTKILRAIAVADPQSEVFYLDSKVATSSYIFPNDVIQQSNTPAGYPKTWGTIVDTWDDKRFRNGDSIPADYEMDPELMAEPAYADSVLRSFRELPIISIVTDKNHLFSKSTDPATGGIYIYTGAYDSFGNNWERPVSMELFQAGTDVSMQTDCGLELHGQASRLPEKSPKHSFKVAFKDEYGIGKLRYPLFGEDGQKSINAFYLRAGFGYTWIHWSTGSNASYNRDEWNKLTQIRMGNFGTHTTYAHLFINGMYWGLYNPIEKADEDYLQYWFGGAEEDYEVHKDGVSGSANWTAMLNAVNLSTNAEGYYKLIGCDPNGVRNPNLLVHLDIDNFIDYMIQNYYTGNSDWDSHNWITFKNKKDSTTGFRFLSWDAEMTLFDVNTNRYTSTQNVASRGVLYIFSKLKQNPLFVRRFMDRVQKHCFDKGWLTPEKAAETWLDLANQIQGALFAESARWGDYRKDVHKTYPNAPLFRKDVHYNNQKTWMLNTYFPQRTDILLSQFRNANLLSSVVAPSYRINMKNAGDTILDSQKLTIYAPAGSIYYTLDGTDPVTFSLDGEGKLTAALTPTAQSYPYQYEIAPTQNMHVKSRALFSGTWSALAEKELVMKTIVGLSIRKDDASLMAAAFPANFKTETSLRGMIPTAGKVRIELYDVSGKLVAVPLDAYKSAGAFEVVYDGSHLKPGMYICRVQLLGEQNRTTQFKLIKGL